MLILVVDDIEKNRVILERFLSSQGHDVICADSGKKSIDLIQKHDVDLVLMDIKMPDMNGYEATRNIKKIQSEHYLPVIFVTALSEEEALEEALEAGGDDFVTKPIGFGILLSKIKAHARIRELHTQVNHQNKELSRHNARLNREHDLISHFFDQARKNCFFDERVIKSYSLPMSVFNGDTVLVARRSSGGVTVLVGDFTGHGLSAAVGTLPVSQIFFSMVEENAFIGDIAREINRQVNILLPVEMFFAASIFELSAKGDRLMVWHGGMPDAYLFNKNTKEMTVVSSDHLPLGVRTVNEFDDSVQLFYVNQDSKFVVFTDGLSEAENTDKVMINTDVYVEAIKNNEGNILESVINSFQEYSVGVPQADDISVLELSCLPVAAENHEDMDKDISKAVPWDISLDVTDKMLKRDVVANVIALIGDAIALKEHKGVVHTLLTEMYNNTLDHGILDLHGNEKDSDEAFHDYYEERIKRLDNLNGAKLSINIAYMPDLDGSELTITMSHNGNSFEVAEKASGEDDFHGRGIELIRAICSLVEYSDDGRSLKVVYNI